MPKSIVKTGSGTGLSKITLLKLCSTWLGIVGVSISTCWCWFHCTAGMLCDISDWVEPDVWYCTDTVFSSSGLLVPPVVEMLCLPAWFLDIPCIFCTDLFSVLFPLFGEGGIISSWSLSLWFVFMSDEMSDKLLFSQSLDDDDEEFE